MAQRVIFICDKCKQEWELSSNECPQTVALTVILDYGTQTPQHQDFPIHTAHSQVWCRPCIDACNVIPPVQSAPPKTSVLTTEDILVDLLTNLGFVRE